MHSHGTMLNITSIPCEGWYLKEMIVNGQNVHPWESYSLTLDSDVVMTVVFEEIPTFTLELSVEGEGDVEIRDFDRNIISSTNAEFPEGEVLYAFIEPADGWEVSNVFVNGREEGASNLEIIMYEHTIIRVIFVETIATEV